AGVFAQDFVVTVDAALGGYYRPGKWVRVIASIQDTPSTGEAGDSSLDVRAVLGIESTGKTSRRESYEFVREVNVPAFSTQRFMVYVKCADPPNPSPLLQIRTEGGRLLKSQKVDVQELARHQTWLVTVSDEAQR